MALFDKKYMSRYITKEEHDEFTKRVEAEHKRLSHRLDIVEKLDEKIYKIIASVEKMSSNIENILKNQERQEKKLDGHGVRIDNLESKDSKKWNDIIGHLWKAIVAAIGLYLLSKMGIG